MLLQTSSIKPKHETVMDRNKKKKAIKEPLKANAQKEISVKKMRTMQSIMDAVGRIIEKRGYPGLTIMNIEAEAKQHRKLIYLYFENVDNLIETYIRQKDFWLFATKDFIDRLESGRIQIGKKEITKLLQDQLNTMVDDKVLQGILHWELGKSNDVLETGMKRRVEIGERLFRAVESDFDKKEVDFRAIMSLLIGGVYYISMHSTTISASFCGIDVNQPVGRKRISEALKIVVEWIYEKAEITS